MTIPQLLSIEIMSNKEANRAKDGIANIIMGNMFHFRDICEIFLTFCDRSLGINDFMRDVTAIYKFERTFERNRKIIRAVQKIVRDIDDVRKIYEILEDYNSIKTMSYYFFNVDLDNCSNNIRSVIKEYFVNTITEYKNKLP